MSSPDAFVWYRCLFFFFLARLEEVGYGMGLRVLELQTFRERLQKRRVRLLPMLQWVSSNVWKASMETAVTYL